MCGVHEARHLLRPNTCTEFVGARDGETPGGDMHMKTHGVEIENCTTCARGLARHKQQVASLVSENYSLTRRERAKSITINTTCRR